jgi:hypothetical protein
MAASYHLVSLEFMKVNLGLFKKEDVYMKRVMGRTMQVMLAFLGDICLSFAGKFVVCTSGQSLWI